MLKPGSDSLKILKTEYLDKGTPGLKMFIEKYDLNVERQVKAYPEAFNTYDSLGEAFMKLGKKELAIRNYEKSLELNPNNKNADRMLEKLRTN